MEKENKVLVGTFNDSELMDGTYKEAVAKAKKEHGLPYIVSKFIKKGGKSVGMRVWVCDYETFEKNGALGL